VTFDLFRGFTYWLTKGQGKFPSVQQYNLGMGKVGKGGRGRNEGDGKWVELADLPTLHMATVANGAVRFSIGLYDLFDLHTHFKKGYANGHHKVERVAKKSLFLNKHVGGRWHFGFLQRAMQSSCLSVTW